MKLISFQDIPRSIWTTLPSKHRNNNELSLIGASEIITMDIIYVVFHHRLSLSHSAKGP